MKKNVVDSSGWLEYFADAENANFFAPAIENVKNSMVQTRTKNIQYGNFGEASKRK